MLLPEGTLPCSSTACWRLSACFRWSAPAREVGARPALATVDLRISRISLQVVCCSRDTEVISVRLPADLQHRGPGVWPSQGVAAPGSDPLRGRAEGEETGRGSLRARAAHKICVARFAPGRGTSRRVR